jgi:hypothetical protein
MSILSVRLPKDLEKMVPKKDRSAWVINAIREQARRQRIGEIAASAAEHAAQDLEILAEWEPATAPLPEPKKRKAKR